MQDLRVRPHSRPLTLAEGLRVGGPALHWKFLQVSQCERDITTGRSECHGGSQTRVDLGGDGQASLGRDERVGLDGVRRVVGRQFTEGKIALCEESLLDTAVTVSMKSEVRRIQAHVLQSVLEPQRELLSDDRGESSLVQRSLEDWNTTRTPLSPVDLHEFEDGDHGTQSGVGGGGEWDFMDSLSVLIVLGLSDVEHDALRDVVVERGDVVPAENHLQIQLRSGFHQV